MPALSVKELRVVLTPDVAVGQLHDEQRELAFEEPHREADARDGTGPAIAELLLGTCEHVAAAPLDEATDALLACGHRLIIARS